MSLRNTVLLHSSTDIALSEKWVAEKLHVLRFVREGTREGTPLASPRQLAQWGRITEPKSRILKPHLLHRRKLRRGVLAREQQNTTARGGGGRKVAFSVMGDDYS
jgi:hypothetical protein